MATATHGSIEAFNVNPANEDWISYTERLEQYFTANDIKAEEADKRRAILLSVCGASTYQLIRNLLTPAKPTDKTFAQLVALVKDHHEPPPSAIVQRKNFNTRVRKAGESISEFIANLRKLSEHCNYGDVLNDMLRDRLVCGCKDRRLQSKLLSETDLTFDKALKLAKAYETAQREANDLQTEPTHIHAVRGQRNSHSQFPRRKQPSAMECYRCGGKHAPADCRFKDIDCHHCGKRGHIAKVCRTKAREQQPRRQQKTSRTNQVKPDTTAEEHTEYTMYHTQTDRTTKPPYTVMVKVNQVNLRMEIDTGATFSIISKKTYDSWWPKTRAPKLESTEVPLRTYTRQPIKVLGTINADVTYQEQQQSLSLIVVAGDGPSLLGRDRLHHISLDWRQINHVNSTSMPCKSVLDRHPDVFKDELGHVHGTTAKFHIKPDA